MKVKKFIDFIVETGVVVSLTGMIISVVIQVFTRFFMDSAPSWTEEVARIFFIYAVVFGGGLAIRDRAYVHLDFFLEKFKPQVKRWIQLGIEIVILVFACVLLFYSVIFVQIGTSETSPSLEFKMSYVFFSMILLGIFIIYYGILGIFQTIKQKDS